MHSRYPQSVNEVMLLNETLLGEWHALPTLLTAQGPLVTWPSDHRPAKTLFTGECCELCGKKIRNVFGIAHTARALTLRVGSECVRHVGLGATGAELAKAATEAKDRAEALPLAQATAAWIQNLSREAGRRGWKHIRERALEAMEDYQKAPDKGTWYLRRLKPGSRIHDLLVRATKIQVKIAERGETLTIPDFLIEVRDRLEGVVP
jgi:hypothetical protein